MKTAYRATLLWFGFLVLAFANGAFREVVLIQSLGLALGDAHRWSCLTGVALWTALFGLYRKKLELRKLSRALLVGGGWLGATFLFETFVLNRHLSWPQILHTYDVSAGEYWGLVLLWIGLLPVAARGSGLPWPKSFRS